jgi:hypothetical protein
MGCGETEENIIKKVASDGFKQEFSGEFEGFTIKSITKQRDDELMTRYKVEGIIKIKGEEIDGAYGIVQHNKDYYKYKNVSEWVFGSCNCGTIEGKRSKWQK